LISLVDKYAPLKKEFDLYI